MSSKVPETMHRGKRKMSIRTRQRVSIKRRFIIATSVVVFITVGLVIFINLFDKRHALAVAASGDYRTAASGNWNATTTWETFNGVSWIPAVATPASADGAITIQNGYTVTVTANVNVDQVTVDAGGAMIIASGKNLTIANGTGNDLTINGSLTIAGTLTVSGSSDMVIAGSVVLQSGGTNNFAGGANCTINNGGRYNRQDNNMTTGAGIFTINSGGVFQEDFDGNNLPVATWNLNSTCEITGIVGTKPGNLNQSFFNLTWNCPNQTAVLNLQGKITTVNGNFNFISTGTGSVRLGQPENYTLAIAGNFNMQGGFLYATTKSTAIQINVSGNYVQTGGTFGATDVTLAGDHAKGTPVINITGDFSISGGTFDLSQYNDNKNNEGITTLNLSGNFTQSGGTFTESSSGSNGSYGYGDIYFVKVGTQTFVASGGTMSSILDFTVNSGAILNLANYVVAGTGTFNLLSGGGVLLGSANGITLSGASGNVQVTGTRSFSTGADYTYNGGLTQVTGNGLPSTVHNLTISNSNNVTLTNTASVTGTLNFTAGNFITSSDTLILGTGIATLGTLSRTSGHVVGYFKRWIAAAATSNILFPIGASTFFEGINYSFTTAPTVGGAIVCSYSATDPGKNGFNLYDSPDSITSIGYGLWTSTSGNGFTGGTFTIDVTATSLPGVSDYTKLHMLRRTNSGSAWTTSGTNSVATGSNAAPVVHRTLLTTNGQFGIGSGSANTLPIELIYFKAKSDKDVVDFTWSTGSEINNDYFVVERSGDGIHFEEVLKKSGAGNSSHQLFYSDQDNSPLTGDNYYRLKQVDFDGHFTYSATKLVMHKTPDDDEEELKIISVVPNPFSESFKLNFTMKIAASVDFALINSSGQIVSQNKIECAEGFNTYEYNDEHNLYKGIYFLNLVCNDQKITKKIIKN